MKGNRARGVTNFIPFREVAVQSEILPLYRLISYDGKAGASSSFTRHPADHAFKYQQTNAHKPWANDRRRKFPHQIWFQFQQKKILARIGFSSRRFHKQYLYQTPVNFDVIASDDCENSEAKFQVLLSVKNAGFSGLDETKTWNIPFMSQNPFLCFGLKIHTTIITKDFAVLTNILMWEKREW